MEGRPAAEIEQEDAIAHATKGEVQPLSCHLFGVAAIGRELADKIGCADAGELLGLLHDLGKYSAEFQVYLQSATGLLNPDDDAEFVDAKGLRGKIDHSTAGAQTVWRALSNAGRQNRLVGQMLALCVASHHSGMMDCLSPAGEDLFTRRMDKPEAKAHLGEAHSRAMPAVLRRIQELIDSGQAVAQGMGLWKRIQSRDAGEEPLIWFKAGLLLRFLFSCLLDADRLDSADFESPHGKQLRAYGRYLEWGVLIQRLETHVAKFAPRHPIDHIRRDISQHCLAAAERPTGIYTLSVPTGGGKTLASLRFAMHHAQKHGMTRVIYVVPFTTIIDQNAKVAREVLEPPGTPAGSVVLEHHSNLMPAIQDYWHKLLAENWDAPVVYTTSVQFLDALFAGGTRDARRMHQLARAVIVFDEVQALPIKTVHLFNNAINFLVEHCGSTAVMCTATQPLLERVDTKKGALRLALDHELMPDTRKLFDDLKRVDIIHSPKSGGWSAAEIAKLAQSETRRAGSCLVIVNTRRAAKELYGQCREEAEYPVHHLSTYQCPAHRRHLLDQITGRLDKKEPVLCISTQLIEAGVDVDFGAVIRFTAGLDSIAQAAGRCNRHGLRGTGHVHVVNPKDENLDSLSDIKNGRDNALRVLGEYRDNPASFNRDLIGPTAMERYYTYAFFDPGRMGLMDYPVTKELVGRDDTLFGMMSTNLNAVSEYSRIKRGAKPAFYFRQSFMSAADAFRVIDAPTQGVIVPYGAEGPALIGKLSAAQAVDAEYSLLRQAQQFTVNVFQTEFETLDKARAIYEVQTGTGIWYLNARHYSNETGLSLEPVTDMEMLDA
jgi:CRISPR-associated endonuclease/helicase Cas3